jgi:endogenous inhibitor of DNA gyrase (YacG/DUF329 family)
MLGEHMELFNCKKTNRNFKSNKALINHLRKVYNDIEEAYIEEKNLNEVPICSYCNQNKCKFISFQKGFSDCCLDKKCVLKKRQHLIKNTEINKDSEFLKYIIENKNFYINNLENKNIIEPYTGIDIKNLTLYQFISRRTDIKNILVSEKCVVCNKPFNKNIMSKKETCSKKCSSLKVNGYKNYKIIDNEKEINNLFFESFLLNNDLLKSFDILKNTYEFDNIKKYKRFINSNIKIENIIKCEYTGYYYINKPKTKYFEKFVKKHVKNIEYYMENYHKEKIINCNFCGKFIEYNWNNKSNYKNFCCKECYHSDLSINKNKYFNENKNKKQSEKMKDLIKEGKFTPNITNSWANSKITINFKNIDYCFRSTWEAIFFIIYDKQILYEKIRIPYVHEGKVKNYITDFVDENSKIIFEVKPKSQQNNSKNKLKENFAKKWCEKNGYSYVFIDEDYLKNNIKKEHIEFLEKYVKINKALKGIGVYENNENKKNIPIGNEKSKKSDCI